MTSTSRRIGIRVDAGAHMGVGHLMRCLALAEELLGHGAHVTLLGSVGGLAWADQQVAERGLARAPVADDVVRQCLDLGLDAVIIDGYEIPASVGASLGAAGIVVAAMVDGSFGAHQVASLYIDHNLGAQPNPGLPADATQLTGIGFAIVGDKVRSRRRAVPLEEHAPLRVLVMLGGTDAYGGSPVLTDALLRVEAPLDIVAVAPRDDLVRAIEALPATDGHTVTVVPAQDDLPALAATCDLAVLAAGSSLWELMCIGVPIAAVAVVDNQLEGYAHVQHAGVIVGLGLLADIASSDSARDDVVGSLTSLATDAGLRDRLARTGMALIDGDGRGRVVRALFAMLG